MTGLTGYRTIVWCISSIRLAVQTDRISFTIRVEVCVLSAPFLVLVGFDLLVGVLGLLLDAFLLLRFPMFLALYFVLIWVDVAFGFGWFRDFRWRIQIWKWGKGRRKRWKWWSRHYKYLSAWYLSIYGVNSLSFGQSTYRWYCRRRKRDYSGDTHASCVTLVPIFWSRTCFLKLLSTTIKPFLQNFANHNHASSNRRWIQGCLYKIGELYRSSFFCTVWRRNTDFRHVGQEPHSPHRPTRRTILLQAPQRQSLLCVRIFNASRHLCCPTEPHQPGHLLRQIQQEWQIQTAHHCTWSCCPIC